MSDSSVPGTAVSVVIPVLNGAAGLRRTIDRLRECDVPGGVTCEVVVSDDGSSDGSPTIAASMGAVVVRGDHAGPSGARNRGAERASGEILAFLDCGDEPHRDWLRGLAEPFREPSVGLATWSANVRDVDASSNVVFAPTRFGSPRPVALPGCFAMRRVLFDAIGGYDPELRFAENTDLCDRLLVAVADMGLAVHYSSSVLIDAELGQPAAHYDRPRLDAMEHLLSRDRVKLHADPSRRARMHGIAAVNAGRCGEWKRARRHAFASIRAQPRQCRSYPRALLTLCPPVARWRWESPAFRRRMALSGR